jgi:hypothetical protein
LRGKGLLTGVDRAEAQAERYFQAQGFKKIVHEPDGKNPPDFLLDDTIAVEVRRLNENIVTADGTVGLWEAEIPLLKKLRKLAATYGKNGPASWLLVVRFRRPLPLWKGTERQLKPFLDRLASGQQTGAERLDIEQGAVVVEARPWHDNPYAAFEIAVTSDEDSGGWLIELLEKNIRICISEKTAKVSRVRTRYAKWWLVLVDEIAFGLSDFDRRLFEADVAITHDFDNVVLVSAADHNYSYELK